MNGEQQPLVLLVDDEEDLCTLMQMSLLRMGIRTHIAHRLEDAKKCLANHQYDACLTDLNLPDGNGLELLDWIGRPLSGTSGRSSDRLWQHGNRHCCAQSRGL